MLNIFDSASWLRVVGVFDEKNNLLGRVIISINNPDAFKWEACRRKNIRVLTIKQ